MARYQCSLGDDLLQKAAKELNEPLDNAERLQAIDTLRESFDTSKYGDLIRCDDAFLLRFLRARKFNQERALQVLQNYHSIRKEFREVFSMVEEPQCLKEVMETGFMYAVNGKSRNGQGILIYRPRYGQNISMYQLMACGILYVEQMLEDEEYQICGNLTVDDCGEMSLRPVFQMPLKGARKFNLLWQDSMPVRIKNVYLFNEGRVFDFVFTIFKPFMKKKLKKRIKLCGKDYTDLHAEVDPALLPPEFQGTGPDMKTAATTWVNKVQENWQKPE
ncbi:alpha-tocopherol transfer protein-like [Clavelina lepadiformis]|uniref:CRAL-TRIO domain-containing protein n=1 Tax=Clavelina lepadiformis TaxID=159417 RepID=A0ABP0F1Z3_CLALP